MCLERWVTIAVLTYNRREQVLRTLAALSAVAGDCSIVVVDNGSRDGTPAAIAKVFPSIRLISLRRNIGAAARNAAVAQIATPYVAFCDDDTQWEPRALEQAVQILEAAPQVAVLSARVIVGPEGRLDPTCAHMENSPLPREGLPGPQLLGFMAGACVMRVQAFNEAEGYWAPFFIGGEEELMALDLVQKGWCIVYAQQVVSRHFPSSLRDSGLRNRLLARNAIWVAWMRRPWVRAWRETTLQLRKAYLQRDFWSVALHAMAGLPRALANRKLISQRVETMRTQLDNHRPPP